VLDYRSQIKEPKRLQISLPSGVRRLWASVEGAGKENKPDFGNEIDIKGKVI